MPIGTPHHTRFGWQDGDLQPVVTPQERSRFGWHEGDLVPASEKTASVGTPQVGWLQKQPGPFFPSGIVVGNRWGEEMVKAEEPRAFGSHAEAHEFGMQHADKWMPHVTNPEYDHLMHYRTGGSYRMNATLRGKSDRLNNRPGPMPLPEALAHRDAISSAIAKAPPLEHAIVGHRTHTATSTFAPHLMTPGTVYHDPGIVSVALHKGEAMRHGGEGDKVHMEIHVPKGTPAAYISHPDFKMTESEHPETEMLLDHHTHFKVMHADPVQRHVVLQVVPHHE